MLTPLQQRHNSASLWLGLIAALCVHGVLILLVLPLVMPDPEQVERDVEEMLAQKEPLEVKEDFPEEIRVTLRTIEFKDIKPPEPKEEEPKEKEEEPKPPEPIPIDRKTVEQVTNEEKPVDAKFVSEQANKTEKETRAVETTMRDVLPSNETTPEQEDVGSTDPDVERSDRDEDPEKTSQELAMAVKPAEQDPSLDPPMPEAFDPPTTKNEPIEDTPPESERPPSPDGLFKPSSPQKKPVADNTNPDGAPKKVDPRKLFGQPSMSDFEKVLGEPNVDPKSEEKKGKKRRRLFSNFEENQKRLKGSLENMITEIQPGNHTSVNAERAVYVGYINALHRRIHERWANDFLMTIDTTYSRSSPLQNPTLNTTLEFVIEAKSGKFEAVNIVRSSGELMFDSEAINTAWNIGKRPNPPPQIVSGNGKVYVHWNFWRDGRQCGVMTASIYLLTEDEDGNAIKSETDMVK